MRRQALAYPEVHARKCLVKNVLREEDLRPVCPPSVAANAEDALMPTIHIGSLRELALKLPTACYPSDHGPATPTTPVMLAHDARCVADAGVMQRSGTESGKG